MTVEPGKGGQDFLKSQVQKIEDLRGLIASLRNPPLIEVDGGINQESCRFVASADVLVSGTYVFRSKDYFQAIASFRNSQA